MQFRQNGAEQTAASARRTTVFFRATMVSAAACSALVLLAALVALLHSPHNAHAQGGPALSITKSAETTASPLQPGDVFTYRIVLSYTGGTQPVQTLITDTLPAGVRPAAPPSVTEAQTETVRPLQLQRRGRTVGWKGEMRPDSQLIATLPVRVETCYGADRVISNSAHALRPDGESISDSADVTVDCLDATINDVEVTQELRYPGEGDSPQEDDRASAAGALEGGAASVQRYLVPGHAATLRITLRNLGTGPMILGVEDDSTSSGCPPWCCLTCTVASGVFAADLAAPGDFVQLTLEPGETRTLERSIQPSMGAPDIGEEGEYAYVSTLNYCLIGPDDAACPAPGGDNDRVATHTKEFPLRPNDLGDAADSSNHAGSGMTAYGPPAVAASFPTVFDPATGLPQGPRHVYPQYFHLGQRVSLEAEADVGPDQDPANNIEPVADSADNERGDDGTNPSTWPIAHCGTMNVPVRVAISARAHAWFAEGERPAYLNIWVDSNRDGDWADADTCQIGDGPSRRAVEHIVIDHPVDVAALGPGLHTVSVPTGVVLWPAALAQQDAWVRVTLSERPANKTLQVGDLAYGDGRGYDTPFRVGETEDYVLTPPDSPNAGADLAVTVEGRRILTGTTPGASPDELLLFQIDYANLGSQTATNPSITFEIPEPLRGGDLTLLRAPDVEAQNISFQPTTIQFGLPDLRMGLNGPIILGWTGCLTCPLVSAAGVSALPAANTLSAKVTATADNDIDSSNDTAQTTLTRTPLPPTLAVSNGEDALWHGGGTTCQQTIRFVGSGVPMGTVQLGLFPFGMGRGLPGVLQPLTATVGINADGTWEHLQTGLPDGAYEVRANGSNGGTSLRLNVDSSLPADPMSLKMVDSEGNAFQPSYAGWPQPLDLALPPGQYGVSLDACPGAEVTGVEFRLGDQTIPAAEECNDGSDRCGPWSAQITIPEPVQAASVPNAQSFQIVVQGESAQSTLDGSMEVSGNGVVRDRVTGAVLTGANVTLLEAIAVTQTTDAGAGSALLFAPWAGSEFGQSNPQSTNAAGGFTLAPPAGTYRLLVTHDGYQQYRTASFTTNGEPLQDALAMTPDVTDAPSDVVQLAAAGFNPAVLLVEPGSVVEFVNVGLGEHVVRSDSGDAGIHSGLLEPGERFLLQLTEETTLTLTDATNPLSQMTIIVAQEVPSEGVNVYLPVVDR